MYFSFGVSFIFSKKTTKEVDKIFKFCFDINAKLGDLSNFCGHVFKVEIFLEQREGAFLSPSKIRENLNFSTEIQILLGDKNAPYLCSKIISTLPPSSSFDKTSFMDVP